MEELADDSKAKAEAQVNDRESRDLSEKERKELDERIRMRKQNPDLVPSMFLWKDFGEAPAIHRSALSRSCILPFRAACARVEQCLLLRECAMFVGTHGVRTVEHMG